MSYLALARTLRPNTFEQLIGQNHVANVLTKSLDVQRLHHAYLFTGTRGVGKTSIARLFAKAMNCELGISSKPCLNCPTCQSIEQGRCMDLIEIDGASNTRVEDTRELLDNVIYAPTQARFKIYLIDEVHMLSNHSFNALLKTLEEPPAHVKFLLATTDPQKLPLTVLSRCLQFNLKPVSAIMMADYLEKIFVQQCITHDHDVPLILADAAHGSLRDALSLLDHVLASFNTHVSRYDLAKLLGHTDQDYALALLQALAELDAVKLMQHTASIATEGGNVHYVLNEITIYLHAIMRIQMLPDEGLINKNQLGLRKLSQQFHPEDIQLFYHMAIRASQELSLAPTLAIGFEMLLLRMYAFRPDRTTSQVKLAHMNSEPTTIPIVRSARSANLAPESTDLDWTNILSLLNLTGLALNAIAHTEFVEKKPGIVVLRLDDKHRAVFTPMVIKKIEDALSSYYSEKIEIMMIHDVPVHSSPAQNKQPTQVAVQNAAHAALLADPIFTQLQETFAGEVVKSSVDLL